MYKINDPEVVEKRLTILAKNPDKRTLEESHWLVWDEAFNKIAANIRESLDAPESDNQAGMPVR